MARGRRGSNLQLTEEVVVVWRHFWRRTTLATSALIRAFDKYPLLSYNVSSIDPYAFWVWIPVLIYKDAIEDIKLNRNKNSIWVYQT
jgi:hypothetical protein